MSSSLFPHSPKMWVLGTGSLLFSLAGGCVLFVPPFTCGNGVSEAGEFCFGEPVNFDVGQNPRSAATGDLNGDGISDLVVANGVGSSVSILFGTGDQTLFAPAEEIGVGRNPQSVLVADVDEDGFLDIITSNEDEGTVTVLFNLGDGLEFSRQDLDVGGVGERPYTVQVADFNNDGAQDIAVANSIAERVGILFFDPELGDFAPFVNLEVGSGARKPRALALFDAEGDGDIDIATANQNSNNVTILLNSGDGSFTPVDNYAVGNDPFSIAAVDLDGDGDIDLFTANKESNTLSLLFNNGTGEFLLSDEFPLGEAPEFVKVGDFDGNGSPDVVVANSTSNDVSPLLAEPQGDLYVMVPASPVPVGLAPHWVEALDINGDGVDDIISVNGNDNNISVIVSAP